MDHPCADNFDKHVADCKYYCALRNRACGATGPDPANEKDAMSTPRAQRFSLHCFHAASTLCNAVSGGSHGATTSLRIIRS